MSNQVTDKKINNGMGEALFSDRERFEMWFTENWKKTAIIALGVVVVFSAAFGIAGHIKAKRIAGAAELSAATTIDTLKAALKKNSDNPASSIARLRLANMLFDAGKYTDAIEYLNAIAADKNADQMLVNTAKLNIAKALELSGKLEESADAFSKCAAASGDNMSIKAEAAFGAARLYAKLGKTAKALAEITNIKSSVKDAMMNPYVAEAASLEVAILNKEYGKIQ